MTVRPATEEDAAAVRAVVERAIRISAADDYPAAQVDAWASGGSGAGVASMIRNGVAFVAVSRGAVIGFSCLVGADVDQLYVDPASGGAGVGRRLYEVLEAQASGRAIGTLTTTASLRAVPAFRKFGFTEDARVDRTFNGAVFPVVQMTKVLDPAP